MKYLITGTLRPEKSREDLLAKVNDQLLCDEAWDLIHKGVITEHGFTIGRRPGFIFLMEGESEEAVRAAISSIPFVRERWFDIEIDPVSPFVSDIG